MKMEDNYIEKDFSDYLKSLIDFFKHNFLPIASITLFQLFSLSGLH